MRNIVIIACLCISVAGGLYTVFREPSSSMRSIPDISKITVPIEIQRLEKVLFGLTSQEDIRVFLRDHVLFSTQFLGLSSHKDEDALVARLHAMIHDTNIRALYQEVQRVFEDLSVIQQQFAEAFRYIRYYYPDFKIPQLATFITGMDTDVYLSEELIIIGLDFFMGENAKFRPIALPEYILSAYQPDYIVPKTIHLLSQQFSKRNNADQTLLADMLHHGKHYYFAQAMLPKVAKNVILAYTKEQLTDVEQHQDIVWGHFIDHELLYVTNHLTKKNYLNENPFTSEIGQRCPGRIGRWLGWEIVKSYMQKNTEVSLPTLMHHTDAQALLAKSRYRPK